MRKHLFSTLAMSSVITVSALSGIAFRSSTGAAVPQQAHQAVATQERDVQGESLSAPELATVVVGVALMR